MKALSILNNILKIIKIFVSEKYKINNQNILFQFKNIDNKRLYQMSSLLLKDHASTNNILQPQNTIELMITLFKITF